MRLKHNDKKLGRFQKSLHANSMKAALGLGVVGSNMNHIQRSQKKLRLSKKTNPVEENSSVISINTLMKSGQDSGKRSGKRLNESVKEVSKPVFVKKKATGSILKHKKCKYEPSKLVDYYSKSSFQKT